MTQCDLCEHRSRVWRSDWDNGHLHPCRHLSFLCVRNSQNLFYSWLWNIQLTVVDLSDLVVLKSIRSYFFYANASTNHALTISPFLIPLLDSGNHSSTVRFSKNSLLEVRICVYLCVPDLFYLKPSNFIYIVANVRISLFSVWTVLCMHKCWIFFLHLPTNGCWGWLHISAIVNRAVINMEVTLLLLLIKGKLAVVDFTSRSGTKHCYFVCVWGRRPEVKDVCLLL